MSGRTTFIVLFCCLIASLIAAPLADIDGTQLEGNEIVDIVLIREGPSELSSRIASLPEDADSSDNSGREAETEVNGGNKLLQGLLGTVLAFPSSLVTGLEGLLNGVVSRILGGPVNTNGQSDSEDFR